jgi:hypothetical protein
MAASRTFVHVLRDPSLGHPRGPVHARYPRRAGSGKQQASPVLTCGGLRALLRLNAPASFICLLMLQRSGSFSGFVLVFMAFPLTWAADLDTGFRAFSACVICVVPLWVMNTTLSFIVPLLARCGTVTPSCSMVLLGPFGSSFGTLTCVRLSLLSRMHSSLVLPYAGYGDLAAATCVAALPPPFFFSLPPFLFSLAPFYFSPSFGHLLWSVVVSVSVCFVDISSCPRGWTDVTSSSSLQEWREKDQPNVQGREPQGFKL